MPGAGSMMPGSGGMMGSAGSGGGAAGGGAKSGDGDKDAESEEPPYLTVPRFDFTVQFIWKETLLTERLEKQVEDWKKEQQKTGAPAAAEGDLATTTEGGA